MPIQGRNNMPLYDRTLNITTIITIIKSKEKIMEVLTFKKRDALIKKENIIISFGKFLEDGIKTFNFNDKQKGYIIGFLSESHRGRTSVFGKKLSDEEYEQCISILEHDEHHINHAFSSVLHMVSSLRSHRKYRKIGSALHTKNNRKERDYTHKFFGGQSIHEKNIKLTMDYANGWWHRNHERTNITIDCSVLTSQVSLKPAKQKRSEGYDYHNFNNELFLQPSWFKNIFLKGLTHTVYKSKIAFIASAKPIPVERLKINGIDVYRVDLITCHDGVIALEKDLWYLVYETKPFSIETKELPSWQREDRTHETVYNPAVAITSASDNFRRVENVMNGRVQKEILKRMGV